MKAVRWMVVLALAWAVAGATPVPTRADEVPIASAESPTSPDELERWWGAVGAVMCGGEGLLLRTSPAVGLNPYVMAAGLAGCGLMLLDMAT